MEFSLLDILKISSSISALLLGLGTWVIAREDRKLRFGCYVLFCVAAVCTIFSSVFETTEQKKSESKLLSSVERGVYTTADPSLSFRFEADLDDAGLSGYKADLDGLLATTKTSVDKNGRIHPPPGCSLDLAPWGPTIITCGRRDPRESGMVLSFDGWRLNLPPYGYQIVGNRIGFQVSSDLVLRYRDPVIARLIAKSGIAVRFFGSPTSSDKEPKPKAQFFVLLEELLAPYQYTVLTYADRRLVFSSGSTRLIWTPQLDWRWAAGMGIGSVVDMLNTEVEVRAFVPDTVCEGISDLNRCRATAKQFQNALRVTSLIIAFPHRRDIVFHTEGNDRGHRSLRMKFPTNLEDFPESPRTPPILQELPEENSDKPAREKGNQVGNSS